MIKKPITQEGLKVLLSLLKGETDKGYIGFEFKTTNDSIKNEILLSFTKADGTKVEHTLPLISADRDAAGLLSADDKQKIDLLELDSNGVISSKNLPSYVDDVVEGYYREDLDMFFGDKKEITEVEWDNLAEIRNKNAQDFLEVDSDKGTKYYQFGNLIIGETGKIYVDKSTEDNKIYRSSRRGYVPISDVPKEILARLKKAEEKLELIKMSGGTILEESLPSPMTNAEIDAVCVL